jgi:hypothetical protein
MLNRKVAEAVKQDQMVYVHKVVWSSEPGDIVDRNVDAASGPSPIRQFKQVPTPTPSSSTSGAGAYDWKFVF